MKRFSKGMLILVSILGFLSLMAFSPAQALAVNAKLDLSKLSDMSDFDPDNPVIPTGDTIKIAVVAPYSGPAAIVGQCYYISVLWAAHDMNKRGGIMVDGKKKLIQVIKADHMYKPDMCKKICERMVLQEKVNVLWGTSGSNLMKIINEVSKKYKVITMDACALSDELYDATNFSRYSFMTCWTTEQVGQALAYYYGQIRKKEKNFYILCQDYMFGHNMAGGFKRGLQKYYPEAEIVGEDYHKLFLTDFAPYLTKIKASGAEVVYTGDWIPDAANLVKQARQMGMSLPFAHIYLDDPNTLHEVGVEGSKGLVHCTWYGSENPTFKTEAYKEFYRKWHEQWKNTWKAPYNTRLFEHPMGGLGSYIEQTYWLFSVIERAASLDPEKIIRVWEGDTYQYGNGKIQKMRACDHKTIQDLHIYEYVPPEEQKVSFNMPPYYWYKGCSFDGPSFTIPAAKILPLMDQKLDRCKGKNDWGE